MSSLFLIASDAGRTLFGTLQQITSSGTLGNLWNVTTGSWAASVAINDRKITLTEGTLNDIGSYTGGTGTLSTYTGLMVKKVHDQVDSNRVVGIDLVRVISGVEQPYAAASDLTGLPALVRTELNSNPVPASNMRGTDSALLAAIYTAPDNASIVAGAASASTAATQATTAATNSGDAKTAAESVETRLTISRAAKIDNLDVLLSTRSTLTAAEVRTELNSNPVPSSNMRGTDNALLAASYTAPANATIATAAADALASKTAAQSVDGKLTSTRAGYLDNLSAGAVAQQTTVAAISNSVRVKLDTAADGEVPASGSNTYLITLLLYDTNGNMEAPDSTPTFTATNAAGTSRTANLGGVTAVATGHYTTTYVVTSAHSVETITILASVVEGGATIKAVTSIAIGPEGSASGGTGAFLSADRTKLEAIFDKLPSKPYLTATAAADGDIDASEMTGDKSAFKADVSALATTVNVSAVPAAVRSELNSNPVPASNMRGTDNALLAASYTAPDNANIAAAAASASTAASSAGTAASQATAANVAAQSVDGKLTSTRAGYLDNLDATITSRGSQADLTAVKAKTDLITGGIALEATSQAIKAKTDLLPTQPAAVGNIPTASQVATAVDSTLSSSHPGDWAAGGDATEAKQDTIIAAIGGIVPTPPSAVPVVSTARTWKLYETGEDALSPNIVTLPAGATVVLAMDFGKVLNPGTGITSVGSVTDLSVNALVPTDKLPSQDRQAAHFTVTGLTAGETYDIRVTVATSDLQTLIGRGTLKAE